MKRGKKYIEAAKLIERGNLYEKRRSGSISEKKQQQQSLTRQSRLTSEQVVTDVMQIRDPRRGCSSARNR